MTSTERCFFNMIHTSCVASRRFVVAEYWVKRRDGGVKTEITVAKLCKHFLRRDETNTAVGAVDMDGSGIKHVTEPASNPDVATKNSAYVDKTPLLLLEVLC